MGEEIWHVGKVPARVKLGMLLLCGVQLPWGTEQLLFPREFYLFALACILHPIVPSHLRLPHTSFVTFPIITCKTIFFCTFSWGYFYLWWKISSGEQLLSSIYNYKTQLRVRGCLKKADCDEASDTEDGSFSYTYMALSLVTFLFVFSLTRLYIL